MSIQRITIQMQRISKSMKLAHPLPSVLIVSKKLIIGRRL
tara:strand:- start:491 stop:610 length:120 start_codon:yes stop_codon:yes gene_type:complete